MKSIIKIFDILSVFIGVALFAVGLVIDNESNNRLDNHISLILKSLGGGIFIIGLHRARLLLSPTYRCRIDLIKKDERHRFMIRIVSTAYEHQSIIITR